MLGRRLLRPLCSLVVLGTNMSLDIALSRDPLVDLRLGRILYLETYYERDNRRHVIVSILMVLLAVHVWQTPILCRCVCVRVNTRNHEIVVPVRGGEATPSDLNHLSHSFFLFLPSTKYGDCRGLSEYHGRGIR